MNWWFIAFMIVVTPLIWWLLWRGDFDGMRTEHEIKKRPKLKFDEFFARYYANSGISESTVESILAITAEQFGIPIGCVRPDDNFLQTDLADTMYYIVEIAEEFEFSRTRQEELASLDGTFDNIVRFVDSKLQSAR